MIEEAIEIQMTAGTSEGFLYRPEGGLRCPGVIHLTDIGGIRPSQRQMARQLAAEGYTVLMPNAYYRTGRPPLFDFTPNTAGDERTMKRVAELAAPLTPDAIASDAADYIEFLTARDSVTEGKMGVVGYCATGAMALRIAAACPERIAAAASFHGGRLFTDAPTSPHRVLPRIKAQLYFGHAIQDRGMPQEAIDQLNQALKAWGGQYESEVYDGAYHSWTVPDSPVYNPPQAERAFRKLADLLARTLKAPPPAGMSNPR